MSDQKEHPAEVIILRGFYRNIMNKLWEDVETGRIPPILIRGISKDIRKILYTKIKANG